MSASSLTSWHYMIDEQDTEASASEVLALADEGLLPEDTPVWTDGFDAWHATPCPIPFLQTKS